MARHSAALAAVTIAGWLVLVDVLQWCDRAAWDHCDGPVGGVATPVLAASVVVALGAVLSIAPRRRSRESLRSRIVTIAPAFLPLPFVVLGVALSDSPTEDGGELLQRLRSEMRESRVFTVGEVLRREQGGGTLLVFDAGATAREIERELGYPWPRAEEVADPSDDRQLWMLLHDQGVVTTWLRLPETLGRCVPAGYYGTGDYLGVTSDGRVTHRRAKPPGC